MVHNGWLCAREATLGQGGNACLWLADCIFMDDLGKPLSGMVHGSVGIGRPS